MDDEQVETLLGLICRHALTTIGGMLAADGYLQSSDISSFVGAGMVIAGVAWSWWQKRGQKEVAALLKQVTGKTDIVDAMDAARGIIK